MPTNHAKQRGDSVWSYNVAQLADPTNGTLYQIRRLIGDVLSGDQQLQDEEIIWTASRFGSIYGAAAECCRDIAAQYARKVDTVQGELRTLYSQQTKRYMVMAADLEARGIGRGAMPYAGGISNADKTNIAQNPDRVPPDFQRGQFDDVLLGTVGEQSPTPGVPDIIGGGNG